MSYFIPGRSADLTQVLRQNHVGSEFLQKLLVNLIEAKTILHPLRDCRINLGLAHRLDRKHVPDDYRLACDFRWIVALVCDPDELIAETERTRHLGSRWKKRNYPGGCNWHQIAGVVTLSPGQ